MDLKHTILEEVCKVLIEHEEKDFVGATVTLHIGEDFQLILQKVLVRFKSDALKNFTIEADKFKN